MKIVENGRKLVFGYADYAKARAMFDCFSNCCMYIDGVGAFGEGKGKVYSFDPGDAEGEEEYLEDAEDIVVCSKKIGQSGCNWAEWDGIFEDVFVDVVLFREYNEVEDDDILGWIEEEIADYIDESCKGKRKGMLLSEAREILKKNSYRVLKESVSDMKLSAVVEFLENCGYDFEDRIESDGCVTVYGNDADYEITYNTNPRYGTGYVVAVSDDEDDYEKQFDDEEELFAFLSATL